MPTPSSRRPTSSSRPGIPSNRTGIPGVPVAGLLATILFLGFALSPRAFQFRAWPEPSRHDAIQEVVDRPVPQAPRVEVAGVRTRHDEDQLGEPRFAGHGALDRRRVPVADARGGSRRRASARTEARDRSTPAQERGQRGGEPEAPQETPPVPAPEQPAQVADVPSNDTNLRPDPGRSTPPAPIRSFGGGGDDDDGRRGKSHGKGKGKGKGHGFGNSNGDASGDDGRGKGGWDRGHGKGHGHGHDGSSSSD